MTAKVTIGASCRHRKKGACGECFFRLYDMAERFRTDRAELRKAATKAARALETLSDFTQWRDGSPTDQAFAMRDYADKWAHETRSALDTPDPEAAP